MASEVALVRSLCRTGHVCFLETRNPVYGSTIATGVVIRTRAALPPAQAVRSRQHRMRVRVVDRVAVAAARDGARVSCGRARGGGDGRGDGEKCEERGGGRATGRGGLVVAGEAEVRVPRGERDVQHCVRDGADCTDDCGDAARARAVRGVGLVVVLGRHQGAVLWIVASAAVRGVHGVWSWRAGRG